MSEHALLSASSSHRWIPCPGSVALCKDIPATTSKYAEEGTEAHAWAARVLTERVIVLTNFPSEEMIEEVKKYTDFIESISDGHTLMVEKRVDYSRYIGVPDSFGTSDAIIVSNDGEEVIICDLKYGRGVTVDADNNPQLMLYALGALEELSFVYPDIKRVRLIIHQPRLNHVSEWSCTVKDLEVFSQAAEAAACEAINRLELYEGNMSDLVLNPGEDQCRFCPAKAICPALKSYVQDATADMFDIVSDELTPETLDLVEGWIKAKRAEIEGRLFRGEKLTHWKLVQGKKGNRKWIDPTEVENTLKSMRLKQEEMYDFSLISPATAEKLLKDNPRKWNRLSGLIVQSDGKPSIAPVSDKRPALVLDNVADGFDVINNDEGVE